MGVQFDDLWPDVVAGIEPDQWLLGRGLHTELSNIIMYDEVERFSYLLKKSSLITSGESVKLKCGNNEMCPFKLLGQICKLGATNCAKALLEVEGMECLKVDINQPLYCGATPLHIAARSLSPGLVELLISHGANADVMLTAADLEKFGMLPLHVALDRLGECITPNAWSPKDSIPKLFIMLCLPDARKALEAIRLLAEKTRGIMGIICHYTKNAKLVELAALMIVAQEKFKQPFTLRSPDDPALESSTTYSQCILTELDALADFESQISGVKDGKKLLQEILEKKAALSFVYDLHEFFERTGPAVGTYLQSLQSNKVEHSDIYSWKLKNEEVVRELTRLLAEEGLISMSKTANIRVIEKDFPNYSVYDENWMDPLKAWEPSESEEEQDDVRSPFYLSRPFANPLSRLPYQPRCLILNSYKYPLCPSSFALHPLTASWSLKASFSRSFNTLSYQMKACSPKMKHHHVQAYLSTERCLSVLSAIRRSVRSR